jgi:hypothetical protein
MPHQIIKQRQRAIVARLIIECFNVVSEHTGVRHPEDLFIRVLVVMGQTEGRPLTPNKVGTYLGFPRTTALRRIKQMVATGRLIQDPDRKTLIVPVETLNGEPSVKLIQRLERLIHDAAMELSKVDTGSP